MPRHSTPAELYRYGTGTVIDKARAYLWFNLAAAQGVEAAAKARDSLVWQLKPEQIAAMQEEARRMSRHGQPGAIKAGAIEATATR
jgi:TPR repeat protein